jgi:hypothetical protein
MLWCGVLATREHDPRWQWAGVGPIENRRLGPLAGIPEVDRGAGELSPADIRRWISEWNADPKPFIWAKTADEILEPVANYCQRIATS